MYKAIHYFKDGRRSDIHIDGSEPFSDGHLDIERNSYVRFRLNFSSGFGGDAITMKIKDDCRRLYLSTDQNHFQVDTTRPLLKPLRQVLNKFDQWSRRRFDNEIVTVKGN